MNLQLQLQTINLFEWCSRQLISVSLIEETDIAVKFQAAMLRLKCLVLPLHVNISPQSLKAVDFGEIK
jgi:hypothetical protein